MARPKGAGPVMASAARNLANQIMSGAYPAGAQLPVEAELAVALGVGRSTVREVVKVLSSKGLLSVAPRRGTIVRPMPDWNLLDPELLNWRLSDAEQHDAFMLHLNEVRAMFEPLAADLAARRRTDADMTAIYRALADMREAAPESQEAARADLLFHNAVAAAAGNPLLRQMAVTLEPALMHTFDISELGMGDAYRANLALHQEIADAIARQDPAKASAASRRLIARAVQDRSPTPAKTAADAPSQRSRRAAAPSA